MAEFELECLTARGSSLPIDELRTVAASLYSGDITTS